MPDPRPYRLASALLALVLVLTGAGPLLSGLCAGDAQHGAATEQAHHCCGDRCPGHPDLPSEDAPADGACCVVTPAVPTESVAVTVLPAPPIDGTLYASIVAVWAEATEVPPARSALADTGGPPLPVRSHLALSVLLI
jgi:hypothetical protein